MLDTIKLYIRAHRKGILAALTAVLVLVVDQETADKLVAAAGVILTIVVPNDEVAVHRVYRKR